ncbi:MAG: CDP-alcohol phosphatidyltransferase family protein [Pseudomonadota bacterium]
MKNWRWLPNVLTVARIVLVPVLVVLLFLGEYFWALIVALIAGISDWLDGALARRFDWQSEFGGFLDPVADKLLMVATYLTLAWLHQLPLWLVLMVVLRDVVIVLGGLYYHFRIERFKGEPTELSKFNTFCQLLLMWVVLVRLAGVEVPAALLTGLVWLVGCLAVATMLQYIVLWSIRTARIVRARNQENAEPPSS